MPRTCPQLAKLTRPRLHWALARERLFERLDQPRAQGQAIYVAGPPGAGKTTLVTSWLEARAIAGIWYQIDAGDEDLATFFYYLGEAAGLALLLQTRSTALEGGPAAADVSRERVFDYFTTQLLAKIPAPLLCQLAATALLPDFTPTMAVSLSGNPAIGALVEDLYRRHLFTYRVSGEQTRFQYHSLFREYLLDVLARMPQPEVTALRLRAAKLLHDTGMFADATEPYASIGDWESLASLLRQQSRRLLAQGRSRAVSEAISRMPAEWVDRFPWLLCLLGTAQLAAAPAAARQSFARDCEQRVLALLDQATQANVELHAGACRRQCSRPIPAVWTTPGARCTHSCLCSTTRARPHYPAPSSG